MKYLIIDDEPIAHEIIQEYASNFPQLRLEKNCYNVFQAIEYLNSKSIDLIFLDINMPKISGIDFLKTLSNPPKVIITTAYKEYALEGYELNVVDYLLKPFSLHRFMKAVNKASNIESVPNLVIPVQQIQNKILLKDGKKTHQISIESILYVEAYGNYTKVITKEKTIVTLEKLGAYLKKLPADTFIQVHKSFIVQLSKIEIVENNKILIDRNEIPIGITFKKNFLKKFK